MSKQFTRRDVLRSAAGFAAGAAVFSHPSSALAEITKTWDTGERAGLGPMVMKIHDISNDHKRLDILGSALYRLHTVFRDQRVSDNSYTLRVNRSGDTPVEFVNDDYWKRSQVGEHYWAGSKVKLLQWQLLILKHTRSFPAINVIGFYEETGVWARGPVGKVLTKYLPGRGGGEDYEITGEFEVQVNLWHLGGGGRQDAADMWSAVLAHEMLHNLGHQHEAGEYVDGRQINAFHRAVYCDGVYDGKKDVPGFG